MAEGLNVVRMCGCMVIYRQGRLCKVTVEGCSKLTATTHAEAGDARGARPCLVCLLFDVAEAGANSEELECRERERESVCVKAGLEGMGRGK